MIITRLPPNATPSLVTSLVSGGPIEQIHVKGSTARVLFLHAKDCQKFYDSTANGLVYSFEDRKGVAQVDKAADVDVLSGQARTFIELGFTRCLRATGIGSDFTVAKLKEKAGYKGRQVEDVVLGTTDSGVRVQLLEVSICLCLLKKHSSIGRYSVSATFATPCNLSTRLTGKKNGRIAISNLALIRESISMNLPFSKKDSC